FRPEISTVINLTPDHLDYMASLDEYYASKMRIYENCESDDEVLLIILMMKLYKNIYKDESDDEVLLIILMMKLYKNIYKDIMFIVVF
ncbi:Mur ligase family protein, partial [Faecalibacillus intestinalis]|uniref:Mur ligase family protein n=1 Tax=Faecalibacillus intestinalis TaxID=1982626 RepID=UPI002FD9E0BE